MNIENFKLDEFTRGWLVGDFEPSLLKTKDIEVAVQLYKAGQKGDMHLHKIATEITVIAHGTVNMGGKIFTQGDILVVPKGVPTDFLSITDSVTVVIKYPSVANDKYFMGHENG